MKGVLEYTEDPIVSADVIGNPHSSIVDGLSIMVLGEKNNVVKILSWYDNEWGFALVSLIKFVAKQHKLKGGGGGWTCFHINLKTLKYSNKIENVGLMIGGSPHKEL
jgi:hypothetical protein